MGKLPDIKNVNLKGKSVFVRADLDVPLLEVRGQRLEARAIEDDARLVAGLPTIHYLLKQGAKVIVGGHLGRPMPLNNELRIKNHELSLRPVAEWFAKHFHNSLFVLHDSKLRDFDGWEITPKLFLLENLRFYEGEEKNDSEFAQKLAKLAEIYVNDAFAMCHRNHASIVGIPKLLSHYAGLRLQKEVGELSKVLDPSTGLRLRGRSDSRSSGPKRPLVIIIGGQKIETKLPLIEKMEKLADFVLVGGKIAQEAKKSKANLSKKVVVASSNREGTDITEESLNQFLSIIKNAKTIVWNGPMGKIQNSEARGPAAPSSHPTSSKKSSVLPADFLRALDGTPSGRVTPRLSERGTIELAKAIAQSDASKVIGGGDTTEFVKRNGLFDKFDFVSTGGGAMLTFLSGEKLPGLEALTN